MNFLVTVICAAHFHCGLIQPLRVHVHAKSEAHCKELAYEVIHQYGRNPRNFRVSCEVVR
jgi:hypothetical protein